MYYAMCEDVCTREFADISHDLCACLKRNDSDVFESQLLIMVRFFLLHACFSL